VRPSQTGEPSVPLRLVSRAEREQLATALGLSGAGMLFLETVGGLVYRSELRREGRVVEIGINRFDPDSFTRGFEGVPVVVRCHDRDSLECESLVSERTLWEDLLPYPFTLVARVSLSGPVRWLPAQSIVVAAEAVRGLDRLMSSTRACELGGLLAEVEPGKWKAWTWQMQRGKRLRLGMLADSTASRLGEAGPGSELELCPLLGTTVSFFHLPRPPEGGPPSSLTEALVRVSILWNHLCEPAAGRRYSRHPSPSALRSMSQPVSAPLSS